MSQSQRSARIEIRQAAVDWHEETDEQGRVWTDEVPVSYRPHYLVLIASNGRILATSEIYHDLTNARRAVGAWVRAFRQVGLDELGGAA